MAGCSLRALAGGDVLAADNGLLSNSASPSPMIVGDREEVLRTPRRRAGRRPPRGSPFRSPGCHLWRGFTLSCAASCVDAVEPISTLAFEEADACGYAAGHAVNGTPRTSRGALTERGDLARRAEPRSCARSSRAGTPRGALLLQRAARAARRRGPLGGRDRGRRRVRERFAHFHNPAAARWSSLKAVALDALGMKKKALELAAEELDRARDFGAPSTVARSLRVLGSLEGAEGLERLEQAVEIVHRAPARLELAKSLAALGVVRRKAGRPDYAREPLARAHELAEVCGAARLLEAIRTEMLAVGADPVAATPRGVGALTATERRVATSGRGGAGGARDRAGAVRDAADDRGQAGECAAQARRFFAAGARVGAGSLNVNTSK